MVDGLHEAGASSTMLRRSNDDQRRDKTSQVVGSGAFLVPQFYFGLRLIVGENRGSALGVVSARGNYCDW